MRFARSDQSPNKTKDTNRIEYEYVTIFYTTGAVPPEKNSAMEPKQAAGTQSKRHFVVGSGET